MSEPVSYESLVRHWFPLIADRLKHVLDGETLNAYSTSFRRAQVTVRGLDAACAEHFDSAKWFPSPESFVAAARAAEARFRTAEQRAHVPADAEQDDSAARIAKAREFARPWVAAHPDDYRKIVDRVNAECCSRFRIDGPAHLTAMQKEMRDTLIVRHCAERAFREQTALSPAVGRPVPKSSVESFEAQRRQARQKYDAMMGKGSGSGTVSEAVSAGSQRQRGPS